MIIWKIALRNLFLHRMKTIVTGLIIVFGTTLAIVGNSVVDAISMGMQNSLTHSVTGDIQIYSTTAKDKIAVLGGMDGNFPDIGHVNDFKKTKDTLLAKVDNIQDIIPMGVNSAMLNPGNLLDTKLEELRKLYQEKPVNHERIEALKGHVQSIIRDVEQSLTENREHMAFGGDEGDELLKNAPGDIAKAKDPKFWRDFDAHSEDRIEFLANKIAPLIFDDNLFFLAYIGTAPELFEASFPQFEIVKGQTIPKGARGFLFSDYIYETQLKHRIARRLDQIKKELAKSDVTIAATKDLQDKMKASVAQSAEIYSQLEPVATATLIPKLQALTQSDKTEIRELLADYLIMNDENFAERYKFFYDEIAPHIELYKVKVGDIFTIMSFTKTGYSSSVNLKVYGTYHFKSFENSPVAGNFNIMDMISFRQLFGFQTPEKLSETKSLEAEMGASEVSKDDVEAMFGSPAEPKAAGGGAATVKVNKDAATSLKGITGKAFGHVDVKRRDTEGLHSESEMRDGVFLNAAVLLKDPSRLKDSIRAINDVSKAEGLGVQATDWRNAAGTIGQLTILVRAVLYLFVAVIFGVATFIIMNSMLMATLERAREIGTMRAIGAQRLFLLRLFLRETFIMSFVFGIIGTLLGAAIVLIVGRKGIPSMGDVSTFFFSGDRLYLTLNPLHIFIVFAAMTFVAIVSTQYPAWRAMKISPLEAMQKA